MKLVCATVLLSIMAVTNAIKFIDCGSKDCSIVSVDVSNCAPDAQSCDFPRGQTVNMTMKFTTGKDITSLTDAIAGYVEGVWVPFKKTNVCDSLTPKCPLKAGTTATYVFNLAISKLYPTINVPVKSDTTDDSGGVCACFEMQGKIV